ncbi:MAG: competence/damage-inducible protein A [Myxococcales bacterium]|nr:competence/damage-inducible protein A [Myxococcales bacterium]
MPTAAVVIIGDEILSGKFEDANGPFLIRRLGQLGCDLKRLVTIGDEVQEIATEVRTCASSHDHVITTGGVGPTHDDRTLEGVAAALDLALEEREDLVALLHSFGLPDTPANRRMAQVPATSQLVRSPGSSFPVVRARNVWVFPGIPKLMQMKFEDVSTHFAGSQVISQRLYCSQHEFDIADALRAVQDAHPSVNIGSYPRWGEADFKVMVSVDGRDPERLAEAVRALRAQLQLVDLEPGP